MPKTCVNFMTVFDKMSEPEKEVSEFLRSLSLWWKYENPIFLTDEEDRPRVWTPDFYLPDLGVHIEVCGSDEFDYKYRKKVYSRNDSPVIFIHYYEEQRRWKYYLLQRIREIHEIRANKIEKVLKTAKNDMFPS